MEAIDEYWASFFGLEPEEMRHVGVRVLPHRRLNGYNGAWVFRHDTLTIVSAPYPLCAALRARADGLEGDPLSAAWIRGAFEGVERIVGPAYDGCVDASSFRPAPPSADTRLLSDSDRECLDGLSRACGEAEWEESGIVVDDSAGGGERQTFGRFVGDTLVAAAQYWPDAGHAARAGVITHPAHRGRGYGKSVRSAAAEHYLRSGGIMLYQTLLSNRPAVAVAEALGFRQYAVHMAARFR